MNTNLKIHYRLMKLDLKADKLFTVFPLKLGRNDHRIFKNFTKKQRKSDKSGPTSRILLQRVNSSKLMHLSSFIVIKILLIYCTLVEIESMEPLIENFSKLNTPSRAQLLFRFNKVNLEKLNNRINNIHPSSEYFKSSII